jgi:hypothetical protein
MVNDDSFATSWEASFGGLMLLWLLIVEKGG